MKNDMWVSGFKRGAPNNPLDNAAWLHITRQA